jgi:hypothetical protein
VSNKGKRKKISERRCTWTAKSPKSDLYSCNRVLKYNIIPGCSCKDRPEFEPSTSQIEVRNTTALSVSLLLCPLLLIQFLRYCPPRRDAVWCCKIALREPHLYELIIPCRVPQIRHALVICKGHRTYLLSFMCPYGHLFTHSGQPPCSDKALISLHYTNSMLLRWSTVTPCVPRNQGSIPGKGKRFLSPPLVPDMLWNPPSLL